MKNKEGKKELKFLKTIDEILMKIGNWFSLMLLVMLAITWINQYYKETTFGQISSVVLAIIFVVCIFIIIYRIFRKTIKLSIIWPLVLAFVSLIVSYITVFSSDYKLSLTTFISGMILIEIYLIYSIVYLSFNKNTSTTNIIILSLLFLVLGYGTIFYTTYGVGDNTIFNSLISVFSAIVGGGLTLGGVAWTIKHEKEVKIDEEIQRNKPFFSFNLIYNKPKNIEGLKVCFPEELELDYGFDVYAEIQNSHQSTIKLQKVFHDNKWFNLEANNVLINGGKLILNFRFTNCNNIFLEVSDVLGNCYYYKVDVLHTALIGGLEKGVHTIRGVEEIDKNMIDKIENKQQN